MINKTFILLFLLCITGSCGKKSTKNSKALSPYQSGTTSAEETAGLKVLGRKGTSYEKGKVYGGALKDEISVGLATWDSLVMDATNLSQEKLYQLIAEKTEFIEAIKQFTPELLEEMNGIADGAGVDRKALLCYNLGEEIMNYFRNGYESCTNVSVINKQDKLIAYNQDLPQFLHGNKTPIVLHDGNTYIFAFPGSTGISGMSQNFAVTCNSIPMLNMNKRGLPLSFMLRKLLTFSTLEEATEYLKKTPLAIPQNLLLVDRNQVVNLEISANQISEYANPKSKRFLYHTNHPLANTDFKAKEKMIPNCERFNYLDSLFTGLPAGEEVSVLSLKKIMSSKAPANIHNSNTYLKFIGKYPHNRSAPPYLVVVNPKKNKESLILTFE